MEKKIIVAVSGGPDSMALLDILHKKGYDCIVAHVNYGVRKTGMRDQHFVEDYCKNHQLKFELYLADQVHDGNFQARAREIRYNFIGELSKKYSIQDVYVAHHQGDLLETYIMQKKRNITPQYYGIKNKVRYKNIFLIRPLLAYSKSDLVKYCNDNNIEYGIDESNLEIEYKRNQIRHEIVDKMNDIEITSMLEEIKAKNIELQKIQRQTELLYAKFTSGYKIQFLLDLDIDVAVNVLRYWFKQYKVYNLSKLEYLNIIDYLKSDNNSKYKINNDFALFKEYKSLILTERIGYGYKYVFDEIEFKDYEYFKIKDSGTNFEGVTVSKQDFPITIRNFQEGDTIKMKYGSKRVSRWFIDNKIGQSERRSWPIVLNKENEVILVPGIGCNSTHFSNNPNMFVVK